VLAKLLDSEDEKTRLAAARAILADGISIEQATTGPERGQISAEEFREMGIYG
jgi:hypothetical protein